MDFWTAFLSAVLGVTAALLGAWFSSKEQRRQWRDGHRLSAYIEMLDNSRALLFLGANVGGGSFEGVRGKQVEALRESMAPYRTSYNKVRLVGPASISCVNEQLHDYLTNTLYGWFESRTSAHAENAPQVIEARKLVEAFLKNAEQALGISEPDSRFEAVLRALRSRRSR